jgi:hypothetical protein
VAARPSVGGRRAHHHDEWWERPPGADRGADHHHDHQAVVRAQARIEPSLELGAIGRLWGGRPAREARWLQGAGALRRRAPLVPPIPP